LLFRSFPDVLELNGLLGDTQAFGFIILFFLLVFMVILVSWRFKSNYQLLVSSFLFAPGFLGGLRALVVQTSSSSPI
jgi:hypothetical protein